MIRSLPAKDETSLTIRSYSVLFLLVDKQYIYLNQVLSEEIAAKQEIATSTEEEIDKVSLSSSIYILCFSV